MYLVSPAQMREIDRQSIDGGLVPGAELMERAGRGIFELIRRRFGGRLADRRFVIVCGKGNNGGDGFVIARHLLEAEAQVRVFVLAADLNLSADAKHALHRLIPLHPDLSRFADADAPEQFLASLADADLVVDALFGTGLSAPLGEPALGVVRAINQHARRVLSVDVPSGLSGDLDPEHRESVRAHLTATVGLPKLGLYYYPGREAAGEVVCIDLGFPEQVVESMGLFRRLVDRHVARRLLPPVDPASHKYRRGSVLLVAGSRRYGGAALLALGGALRSGAGMVYAALPASLASLAQSRWPSAITLALPESAEGALSPEVLPLLADCAARADAVALGPGLGRSEAVLDLLRRWLPALDRPAVLDADALFAYEGNYETLAAQAAPRILTPHTGELAAVLGVASAEIEGRREAVLRSAARERIILMHKGAPTEILAPDACLYTVAGGHPAMARGGTGDVLTGLVGGLLAQAPAAALDMTLLGAWMHAEAGRRAALARGRGLHSADLIDFIPEVWKLLEAADQDPEPWR